MKFYFVIIFFLAFSCKKSSRFSSGNPLGGAQNEDTSTVATGSGSPTVPDSPNIPDTPGDDDGDGSGSSAIFTEIGTGNPLTKSDEESLEKCIFSWGVNSPFKSGEPYEVKKLKSAVTIAGIGRSLVDDEQTTIPQLILISSGVSVGGSSKHELLNENGWYCLKTEVNIKTTKEIILGCKSELVNSSVVVNIGSSGSAGGVGVNVWGTEVTVERKSGC